MRIFQTMFCLIVVLFASCSDGPRMRPVDRLFDWPEGEYMRARYLITHTVDGLLYRFYDADIELKIYVNGVLLRDIYDDVQVVWNNGDQLVVHVYEDTSVWVYATTKIYSYESDLDVMFEICVQYRLVDEPHGYFYVIDAVPCVLVDQGPDGRFIYEAEISSHTVEWW